MHVRQLVQSGTDREGVYTFLTLSAPGTREHNFAGWKPCPCTPAEGVDLYSWNPSAAGRWHDLYKVLKLRYPGLQFFRAAEIQKRGALHFHLLLRTDTPFMGTSELRRLAIRYGFGHEVDVQLLAPDEFASVSGYVSKYVSKAAGQRAEVPWLRDGDPVRATYKSWSSSREWGLSMADVRRAAAGGRYGAVREA